MTNLEAFKAFVIERHASAGEAHLAILRTRLAGCKTLAHIQAYFGFGVLAGDEFDEWLEEFMTRPVAGK